MMFRSLAISSSLLALLVSGPVMAMEDRDENDRKRNGGAQDSPLSNSSKKVKQEEAKEEKPQPQGINKKLNDMVDAVKQGPDEAKLQLGKVLRDGVKDENGQEIIKRDPLRAKELFEEVAMHREDTGAQYKLGKMLRDGVKDENGQEIIKRDPLKAKDWFEESAMWGDRAAQCKLGEMARDGVKDENGQEIIKRDLPEAMDWFIAASRSWYKEAQFQLTKCMKLLEVAAQDGDPDAQCTLGKVLRFGVKDKNGQEIIKRDFLEAIKCFKAAAENDYLEAQFQLGEMLWYGVKDGHGQEIIKGDFLEAIKCFKAAAENDHTKAQFQFGMILWDGVKDKNGQEIVKKDRLNAIKWFKAAAEKGHKKAEVALQQVALQQLQQQDPSQESIVVKINHQSIVQGLANQLLEEMKKNSEVGKKLIAAQQDHKRFSEMLQKTPDVPVGPPQYQRVKETKEFLELSLKHITQSIETFEKKHKKWLKNNNKYGEMRQNVLTALVGKMAQDGEITENAINEVLSGLGWDFGVQE